jgi:hypothetical protein
LENIYTTHASERTRLQGHGTHLWLPGNRKVKLENGATEEEKKRTELKLVKYWW